MIALSKTQLAIKLAQKLAFCSLLLSSGNALSAITFQDVTNNAGPFGSSESWGSGWGDFNGDGFPDVYMSKHRSAGTFYQNNGNGGFSDRTSQVDGSSIWPNNSTADTHGYTWADFDNDGDEDLFGAVSADTTDAHLLLNQNGSFLLKSRERNLFSDGRGRMGIWFDYDNDGLLDMGIPHNGFFMYRQNPANVGHFLTDNGTGLNCTNLNNYGQLIDTNNDGRLEFLCAREGTFPHKVYDTRSRPFTDVTSRIPTLANVNDSAIHDFDGDLRNDIAVTRGRMRPNKAVIVNPTRVEAWLDSGGNATKGFKFKSNGAITFTEYSVQIDSPAKIYLGSSGSHPASLNFTVNPSQATGLMANTSAVGIYIGFNSGNQEWTVLMQPGNDLRGYFAVSTAAATSNLSMINAGGGDGPQKPEIVFNKASGFAKDNNAGFINESCVSIASGDFDNDTDVDIYMVCRQGPENLANVLYENQGNGHFTRIAGAGGAAGAIGKGLASGVGVGESVTVADYNADGYLDLLVMNGLLMQPEDVGGRHQLFKNTGNGNKWIELDLVGKGQGFTNRNGIGAKIFVTGNGKTQLREQNGGYHRWAQNHQRVHFGLGGSSTVNIRVEWPSGIVDQYNNVASNRIYKVNEAGAITVLNIGSGGGGNTPSLSIVGRSVNEAAGAVVLNVTLANPPTNSQVMVNYSSQDVTAVNGVDYTPVVGTLVFNAGQALNTISIPILDDGIPESTETFTVSLANATGASISNSTATVSITDDDSVGGGPSLSIADESFTEGQAGAVKFTITLSSAASVPVTVQYATVAGTALAGADFYGKAGTLTFNAGQTSKNLWVGVKNDNVAEAEETFTLQLSNPNNATITKADGVVTITDDEYGGGGGSASLSVADVAFTEGEAGAVKFTITLSSAASVPVTVQYATVPGTALAGSDYFGKTGTLTFNAGQTTKNLWVGVKNDNVAEAEETFALQLSNPNNATISKADGIVTITDDESGGGGGSASLSVADVAFTEGQAGAVKFTITLSSAASGPVTVQYATVPGAALAGSDYSGKTGTLTFNVGQTTKNLWVGVKNDNVAEAEETFALQLSNPNNATIAKANGVVTITDDETGGGGGSASLSVADAAITEGAAGAVKFTVSLSAAVSTNVTVKYATANGTAIAGSDYFSKNGTLTFNAGQTTKNVWVGVKNDSQAESEETFILHLSNPANATITDPDGTATITDDDSGGGGGNGGSLSINNATKKEGTGAAKLTVTLSSASTAQVKVKYKTVNGSATSGPDYTYKAGTLTFNPGETSKNIWVPVKGDSVTDPNETFTVRLSNPINATIADNSGTVTITE